MNIVEIASWFTVCVCVRMRVCVHVCVLACTQALINFLCVGGKESLFAHASKIPRFMRICNLPGLFRVIHSIKC